MTMNRRRFLAQSLGATAGIGFAGLAGMQPQEKTKKPVAAAAKPEFKLSLAEWSLHRSLRRRKGKKLDNLDFAKTARSLGFSGIEYVNQFFMDKPGDENYLAELRKRAEGEGVRSVLIMCDGLGQLGDPDADKRNKAVENHHVWVRAARFLGCHSIRVNARSRGSYDEQMKLAADGLRQLCEFGDEHEINVIVENHGGLSSNGKWLASVIKKVDHKRAGTLPDFGNFRVGPREFYDRYEGVRELMPYAKGVSAKSYGFDEHGNETKIDYFKMMKIVLDAGYHGFVGVEYEGQKLSEIDGIIATKKLLERVRAKLG